MHEAADVISVLPDALSPGILREITEPPLARLENAHGQLHRLRRLIEVLRDVEDYEDSRVDSLLACIGDMVDMTLLLTGSNAAMTRAAPVGAARVEGKA